jgi:phosphatidylserine/phosphatidylglycerophosphate/cardiolipin synthase-like enzyme
MQLTASILEYAKRDPAHLGHAISEALIEVAGRLDRVSIAVTGLAWLGAGVPSVEQEMLSLVRGAQREIALCAYSITAGAATLLQEVKGVVTQGVNATIVVNALDEQPASVQAYLRSSAQELPGRWRVLDFARRGGQTDLHAKLLIVDRAAALVGSANLSFHGMVSNHEIAVVVRGPTAEAMAARFDMLIRSASVRACS